MDVVFQTGPWVFPGNHFRARPPWEELLDEVQRPPHRPRRGERPEVARPVVQHPSRNLHAWPLLLEVDLQIGIVFVVLQAHVEERLVPLHQSRLQQKRFLYCGGKDEVDVRNLLDQPARLLLESVHRAEVRPHAVTQQRRLPDVYHSVFCAAKNVHAGLRRHRLQAFFELGFRCRGHRIDIVSPGAWTDAWRPSRPPASTCRSPTNRTPGRSR